VFIGFLEVFYELHSSSRGGGGVGQCIGLVLLILLFFGFCIGFHDFCYSTSCVFISFSHVLNCVHWFSWFFHGFSLVFVGSHWFSLVFISFSLVFIGFALVVICCHWFSSVFIGFSLGVIGFYWLPLVVHMFSLVFQ
jgi:hypothetical protein